jgi:hypothetical protein
MKQAGLIVVIAASLSGPSFAAEFSGVPVTRETLPVETLKPIPLEITTDQFDARLKEGGTVVLNGNVLNIVSNDPGKLAVDVISLDRLVLKNKAKIITNGNILSIYVNTLDSEDGSIVGFDGTGTAQPKAPPNTNGPGSAGYTGAPGSSGGTVSLHVIKQINGVIHVNLNGQAGGAGGDGIQGLQPPQASRGEDAADAWPGGCKHSGANGATGFPGGKGGAAGAGGQGGDGGVFLLTSVGNAPLPISTYTFQADSGAPGAQGRPGLGGPGGRGGDGGHGSAYCGGGHGGSSGPPGPAGDAAPGAAPGKAGNYVVKNLDLEATIRSSIIDSSRLTQK